LAVKFKIIINSPSWKRLLIGQQANAAASDEAGEERQALSHPSERTNQQPSHHNARFYKQQLQELLQMAPRRGM
jgi:hypothetical protein